MRQGGGRRVDQFLKALFAPKIDGFFASEYIQPNPFPNSADFVEVFNQDELSMRKCGHEARESFVGGKVALGDVPQQTKAVEDGE